MTAIRALFTLVLIGTLPAFCPAASSTRLDVEIGWNGSYRNMHWSPVFITASDAKPRNVVIELYVPHDSIQSMRIDQLVTIGPTPSTFVLYAPLGARIDEMSVSVFEPGSFRTLANWVNDPSYGTAPRVLNEAISQLVGISGKPGNHGLLEAHFKSRLAKAEPIDPLRLPAVARGYDSFNVLLLDQPDLSRISLDQQQAIVDWVVGGGHLVVWIGEDQLPAASPLLNVLPATVGDNTSIAISPAALKSAGLPTRFGNLKGRALAPVADATAIEMFGGEVKAYRRELGMGTIVLVPIDPSTLLFENDRKPIDFWKPLLAGAVDLTLQENDGQQNYVNYGSNDPMQWRRSQAASRVMDTLGDVPGAGRFGFTNVALVMIGLMVLVGPVDWIVLKRLGRQPWTWFTTSGWIALVTIGAIYVGHVLKSGDLHFRTLRLIDQQGDSAVGWVDAIGIYSPRTSEYTIKTDPETWWEPLSMDFGYTRSGRKTDISFHQDYRGTTPRQMRINVWNLRFLSSETSAVGPPILQADLRYEHRGAGNNYVTGTIKNVGSVPLQNFVIRIKGAYSMMGDAKPLQPGAEMQVERRLQSNPTATTQYNYYGNPYSRDAQVGIEQFFDMSMERSRDVDTLLRTRSDVVVIYAESATDTAAVAQLDPPPTAQRHQQMVRAVLPLGRPNP